MTYKRAAIWDADYKYTEEPFRKILEDTEDVMIEIQLKVQSYTVLTFLAAMMTFISLALNLILLKRTRNSLEASV